MSVYRNLRDAVYDSLQAIFPEVRVVQAYMNGSEVGTPYITFDIAEVKQQGREQASGDADADGFIQVITHHVAKIKLDFHGKHDGQFAAAELANEFYFSVDSPMVQEEFLRNELSYLRKSSLKEIPRKRETDWYMSYQLDTYFSYQVVIKQFVSTIERVSLDGTFIKEDGTTIEVVEDINPYLYP